MRRLIFSEIMQPVFLAINVYLLCSFIQEKNTVGVIISTIGFLGSSWAVLSGGRR
jgi:hypothetical protein